ncbi:growth arrest and DNA damage-inducible proteins-interacting protein 1 [Lampris incognitus]|uniref:growth arrest and DNA damage-inducible proteins-interacting protein 1 n=1 Tax=Lampris incognitus TaxID=2546036 RepID=UPI0024B60C01|nr:growth arrest and DNA damage-inducible proteins-interacting protein 1 [Lampris incognitus]
MAASMVFRRTATFCGTFKGISSFKTNIPANLQRGLLIQIAHYNPKPLKLNLRDPYIPDKENEKTPEWQKTFKYDRKLYGRYGSASGIDPATLWPTNEQLEEIIKEENEWHPPLEVLSKNIAERERQEAAKRQEKEKLVAANMAKMPKMIADWRREKREAKKKLKEDKLRRAKLLAEAQERFGYAVDYRSPKFLEMVKEIEKEEKKKKKLMKRRLREEQAAAHAAPVASP